MGRAFQPQTAWPVKLFRGWKAAPTHQIISRVLLEAIPFSKSQIIFENFFLKLFPPLCKGLLVLLDNTWILIQNYLISIVEKIKMMTMVDIFTFKDSES